MLRAVRGFRKSLGLREDFEELRAGIQIPCPSSPTLRFRARCTLFNMTLRLSADIGSLDGCTLTLFSPMAMRIALLSRAMPDGGEEVVAAVLADDVVLAETASPDGARWRTASPFWNVT